MAPNAKEERCNAALAMALIATAPPKEDEEDDDDDDDEGEAKLAMTLASAGAAAPPKVAKDEVQDATIAKDAGKDEVLVAPLASVAAESKSKQHHYS